MQCRGTNCLEVSNLSWCWNLIACRCAYPGATAITNLSWVQEQSKNRDKQPTFIVRVNGCLFLFKKITPYQPLIASGIIVGKFLWFQKQSPKWTKEISDLSKQIKKLTAIQIGANIPAKQNPALNKKIQSLIRVRKEKISGFQFNKLTWAQIPSLLFPDFFFNIWNTGHQIVSRGILLQRIIKPVGNHFTPCTQTLVNIAGGMITLTGAATSLLRQINVISPDNPAGLTLIGLAIAVSTIEGIILVKNWAESTVEQNNPAFK